ncbi:hypothetical protein BATDEDRAFT_34451 [Batrachochytrium dendrobatidis JAM81]|uniref:Cyclic nucleotide-binding domain-containing protein n=1 Tax=Batrachochytrium dendrobatidis (strain JAM81 / FGSC 10211) TaxID=684364 RepID=F4NWD3_BATDJ|nr:uncharacterized protein BATDEDRAFT_34451 [Batrachochytrium dendrobatidis JAM81]EGF82811.1 hypothetical protein BATDEDRAFT_34451 [Batrachochytrium dendrobatidis JAM81]|eukprot:XP_006676807.1 hypothetical protein BATDEDRAFT_34451 [Batrachochytrium dendrobatidis JAM81]
MNAMNTAMNANTPASPTVLSDIDLNAKESIPRGLSLGSLTPASLNSSNSRRNLLSIATNLSAPNINADATVAFNSSTTVAAHNSKSLLSSAPLLSDTASPTTASANSLIPGELYTLLTRLPFFAGVSETDEFLHEICKTMTVRKYSPGDIVIHQGEVARAMFFIIKGSLKVVSEDDEVIFGELNHGTFFGEIGILFDIKRTATVIAKVPCTLVILRSDVVHKKLVNYPEIERVLKAAAQDRLALMSQELQRVGRKPSIELQKKFLEELKDSQLAPLAYPTSRKQSIRVDMMDVMPNITFEPRSREPTSERSDEDVESSSGVSVERSLDVLGGEVQTTTPEPLTFLPHTLNIESNAMSSQAMLAKRLDNRRRVSVAVWSDDKLMKFAQTISGQAAARETTMKNSFKAEPEHPLSPNLSEFILSSNSADTHESFTIMGLGPSSLLNVFRYFDFRQRMRLRRVSKYMTAFLLEKAHNLVSHVDLFKWHKSINDKTLENIMRFCGSNVITLNLKSCWQITDQGLFHISQYATHLQTLGLASLWDITEVGLASISEHCKYLQTIELSNCRKLSDQSILNLLDRCQYLNTIGLSYCKSITEAIMGKSIWQSIKKANFQRCTGIFDSGFLKWQCLPCQPADLAVQSMQGSIAFEPGLDSDRVLDNNAEISNLSMDSASTDIAPQFFYSSESTDSSIKTIPIAALPPCQVDQTLNHLAQLELLQPTTLPNPMPYTFMLEELNLSDCSFLTDQTISVLSWCCPRLKKLGLSFCCSLTEQYADILVQGCNEIHSLDVSYCGSAVTDASLGTLAQGLPSLGFLNIRGCVQVTDAGINHLVQVATKLHAVNLTQCKSISKEAIQRASKVCELVSNQSLFEDFVTCLQHDYDTRTRATTASTSHHLSASQPYSRKTEH